MAARKNTHIHEKAREAIQTTQIVKRLTYHILGVADPAAKALNPDAKPVMLSSTQVAAANTLLRKTLPDLATTEVNIKGQLEQSIISFISDLDKRENTVPQAPSDSDLPTESDTIQ